MLGEITNAFQGVKALLDLVKAKKELSNSTELVTAINDVQMKLSEAIAATLATQEKQTACARRVQELETQLRENEDWKNQMQSYELFEFSTKALAYKLKEEMASGKPMHYLCITCAEKKKKTTLQPSNRHLHCPECKSSIRTEPDPPSPNRSNRQSWKTM